MVLSGQCEGQSPNSLELHDNVNSIFMQHVSVYTSGFIVSTQTSGFTIIAWLLMQWAWDSILFLVRLLQETRPGQLWVRFVWPNVTMLPLGQANAQFHSRPSTRLPCSCVTMAGNETNSFLTKRTATLSATGPEAHLP